MKNISKTIDCVSTYETHKSKSDEITGGITKAAIDFSPAPRSELSVSCGEAKKYCEEKCKASGESGSSEAGKAQLRKALQTDEKISCVSKCRYHWETTRRIKNDDCFSRQDKSEIDDRTIEAKDEEMKKVSPMSRLNSPLSARAEPLQRHSIKHPSLSYPDQLLRANRSEIEIASLPSAFHLSSSHMDCQSKYGICVMPCMKCIYRPWESKWYCPVKGDNILMNIPCTQDCVTKQAACKKAEADRLKRYKTQPDLRNCDERRLNCYQRCYNCKVRPGGKATCPYMDTETKLGRQNANCIASCVHDHSACKRTRGKVTRRTIESEEKLHASELLNTTEKSQIRKSEIEKREVEHSQSDSKLII